VTFSGPAPVERGSPYEQLIAAATADPDVIGLILTGSRGRGAFVRPGTDWDVRLIVADDAIDRARARHATPHGSRVEVFVMSLSTLEGAGAVGATSEWDRYSFVRVPVVIDKLDGRIRELITTKSVLSPEESRTLTQRDLGAYINAYYRALKNADVGLATESHLDAAESISPLLSTLFAMSGRVRPFNRYLRWELEEFPLPDERLAAGTLLTRLERIVATGDVDAQAALFRDLEDIARAAGYGDAIDAWEPDVDWLRHGHRPSDDASL
jgi:hypothetical protein